MQPDPVFGSEITDNVTVMYRSFTAGDDSPGMPD